MTDSYDELIKDIQSGREGKNKWIPFGFRKLDSFAGLSKRFYYLIGGESGTGKTSLVDQMFVLNPYQWYRMNQDKTDVRLRIIYRSMERSKKFKLAKWVAQRLWTHYHILVDVPTLLGWGMNKRVLPNEVMDKVIECKDYFDEMFEIVNITDGADNPTGIYKQCISISLTEGKLLKSDGDRIYLHTDTSMKGKEIKTFSGQHYETTSQGIVKYYEVIKIYDKQYKIYQYDTNYFPEHENSLNVLLIDHIGKLRHERGFNDKQTLDKGSDYFGELRDIFGWTPVVISQFNRNISSIDRRVKTDLSPEKQDFKGTGDIYEDCDFAMGLFNPRENGLDVFKNYNLHKLTNNRGYNRFRSIHILKNTYGIDNITMGLNFIGECGYFDEMPLPSELDEAMYYNLANPAENLRSQGITVKNLME